MLFWCWASVIAESALLLTVLSTNLFVDWDTWARYGGSQVFALHVVSVCVALWTSNKDTTSDDTQRNASRELLGMPLLLMRLLLVATDTMAVVRAGRGFHNGKSADDLFKLVVLCLLELIALFRVFETWRWRQHAYTARAKVAPAEAESQPLFQRTEYQ